MFFGVPLRIFSDGRHRSTTFVRNKCVGAKERVRAGQNWRTLALKRGQVNVNCDGEARGGQMVNEKRSSLRLDGQPRAAVPTFGSTDIRGRLSPHELFRILFQMSYSLGEDDFGVEEGAGNAGGDGEQFGLAGEDFDLAGAGEFGEVDGASAADAGGGRLVGGDGGKVRQELAGVDEESVQLLPGVEFC